MVAVGARAGDSAAPFLVNPAQLHVTLDRADVDLVIDVFWSHGTSGVEERAGDATDRAILVAGFDDLTTAQRVLGDLERRVPTAQVDARVIEDDTYLDEWRSSAMPLRVGRITLWPRWIPDDAKATDEHEIVIPLDPGRAFGFGNHPTTQHVLAELQERVTSGDRVLDLGCGSGVLAIAAVRLGAARAVGVDIDPEAVRVTLDNARHSEVDQRLQVSSEPLQTRSNEPSANDLHDGAFDIIAANIGVAALVELAPVITSWAKPGTTLILSGLLDDQIEQVSGAYRDPSGSNETVRWREIARRSTDGWTSLTLAAEPRD